MGDNEMRGFVFAVSYILFFSLFITTIPVDFQGLGESGEMVTPLDPALLVGFQNAENWTKSDYSSTPTLLYYEYPLGGWSWITYYNNLSYWFTHHRKILVSGLWFGNTRVASFYCINGTNRGTSLTFDEIEGDSEEGIVRYNMILGNGDSAGALLFGWNDTLYSDPEDAWDNDALSLLQGLGIDETQSLNIGNLLLGLMLLQVPEVPIMVSAFIIVPTYAALAYIVWFIITSMIPFLGGG